MNYLQKTLFDLMDERPERLSQTSKAFDGFFVYDLLDRDHLWIDPHLWLSLGFSDLKMIRSTLAWRGVVLSDEPLVRIRRPVGLESGFQKLMLEFINAAEEVRLYEFEGTVLRLENGSMECFAGTYRQLAAITPPDDESEYFSALRNLSHELRTPLNGVVGVLDLLGRTHLDDEQRSLVDLCMESSSRLSGVICDILEYSSLIHEYDPEIDQKYRSFCLRSLLDEIEVLFRAVCTQKGITITVCISDDIPQRIAGDYLKWRQLILNFVSNAVKFTQTGLVRISVMVRNSDTIEVTVDDEGSGMHAETISRLSTPFIRGDRSLTNTAGGIGVGAAAAYRIIREMNGELYVWSREGLGTILVMKIPICSKA